MKINGKVQLRLNPPRSNEKIKDEICIYNF